MHDYTIRVEDLGQHSSEKRFLKLLPDLVKVESLHDLNAVRSKSK